MAKEIELVQFLWALWTLYTKLFIMDFFINWQEFVLQSMDINLVENLSTIIKYWEKKEYVILNE